jgi:hypothetical protein
MLVICLLFSIYTQSLPQAIIHIGPHKASSSHIQTSIFQNIQELRSVNYHWPTHTNGNPFEVKGISKFAHALKGLMNGAQAERSTMSTFLDQSRRANRNILMSSEEFDDMNSAQIDALKKHLLGFNVTIVFVYRDLLSQLVSLHFELNRFEHAVAFSTSFSAYLFRVLDTLPLILNSMEILSRYAAAFKEENIRIIDLMGTDAANKDTAHTLVCSIAGVLCDREDLFRTTINSNQGYDLVPAQVFSFLKLRVSQQNQGRCHFCDSVQIEYDRFTRAFLSFASTMAPPINVSKLTMLVPYAQQTDTILRAKYGDQMLNSNQTANFEAMAKVQVRELDPERFIMDAHWTRWIEELYTQLRNKTGRLCDC